MFQRMERRGLGDALHEVVVSHEIVVLLGKVFRHLTNESLPTIWKAVGLATERDDIISIGGEPGEMHLLVYLQIAHQSLEGLSLRGTADEVHARLKLRPLPGEALQASAYLCALFQYRDLIAILGQYHATRQTA